MKKILIVDDEPNIVMSLEYLFKKEGFQVFIARDGEEALATIAKDMPDLVLLDIMMPKVDGYQVIKYLKASEDLKNIKVIFLSAKSKAMDIEKGLSLGADKYIAKPFSTKKLVKEVKELINTK
ncbi:MAG: response regulator [Flavobacteriaceae bacterium]|nr:MAG: response regulator [Flavobacteriaceae bacterium]